MTEEIFNAYRDDGWHIFKLLKTKSGDGNAVKGLYKTPLDWNNPHQTYNYHPKSVYGGVPPRDIVAIDWDVKNGKKHGDKSFEQLQKDLGVTLETVVSTPSRGGHCYVRLKGLPDDTPKLKKTQDKYPDIEFQSHGSEFVVLGGQTVEGYGEYSFTDEDFEYFVNNAVNFSSLELRKERVEGEGYDDVDYFTHVSSRPNKEDLVADLALINPDDDHDSTWQQVAMILNSWDLNGKEGEELFVNWSLSSEKYVEAEGEDKIRDGAIAKYRACVSDTPDYYKKIFTLAGRGGANSLEKELEQASTEEDLTVIAEKASKIKLGKNRLKFTDKLCDKSKEITGKPQRAKWKRDIAFHEEAESPEGVSLYLCQGRFIIQHNQIIVPDVGTQMVGKYLGSFGYSKAQQEKLHQTITPVENLRYMPDYIINAETSFSIEDNEGTQLPSFVVRSNPLINIGDYIHDEEIIDEFVNGVWAGKVLDIVRLIALTIKTGEQKLNRLMIVAPSDSGKSEICTMMGFQKINMRRLLNGLRGDKGIGSAVIDGVRKSALLLIDEANKSLEAEIKDMDKELHVDQFGSGGTQILPLHFTTLTSTHKTATRNNSDELANRFLQIELTKAEMKHTVTKGKIYLQDRSKYTEVITSFLLSLFRSTIVGEEGKNELIELQDKYRLPTNNDLDELLFDIGEEFITSTRAEAIHKNGKYYYKRKTDVSGFFEDKLGELSALDVGKYTEILMTHFVSDKRTSVKIDGKAVTCYETLLTPFTEDTEQLVTALFDDLDIEDL